MIKNVNTSSFKQKIHYPNLTINEVSHLFKQSPLLHTTNDLSTKSLIASDVRGHFKSNVRSLLAENYKDIVTNDSNGNGKSGQVHKTTTVYLLRQLLISLQSLNPAEQNKLGVTKHIQEIQLALETIRSQNFIKMNLQIESSKASTKIETIDIHESLPVGEDRAFA